jgi:hypothetical protein
VKLPARIFLPGPPLLDYKAQSIFEYCSILGPGLKWSVCGAAKPAALAQERMGEAARSFFERISNFFGKSFATQYID